MSELDRKSLLVSDGGGVLEVVTADGEVLAALTVPAGRVRAAGYLDLVPEGATLKVASGLAVVQPRSRIGIQKYGEGSHDSGANPDFRPTSASRMEREMRLTLSRMQAATSRVEARERQLAKIEHIPRPADPVVDDAPVIEPSAPLADKVEKTGDK